LGGLWKIYAIRLLLKDRLSFDVLLLVPLMDRVARESVLSLESDSK
jgi:hypothetical protein